MHRTGADGICSVPDSPARAHIYSCAICYQLKLAESRLHHLRDRNISESCWPFVPPRLCCFVNSWTTTRLVCIGSWSPYLHFVEKRAFLRVAGQMSGSPLFPSTFNSSRSGGARPFSLRRRWSMASSSLSYENVAGCYGRQPRSDRFMTRRTERNREKWLLTRHSGRKRAAARLP